MRWSPPEQNAHLPSLRARAVAGEQHDADVGRHAGVVERAVELVDGVRPEGVEHLGPVERDAHDARLGVRAAGARRGGGGR